MIRRLRGAGFAAALFVTGFTVAHPDLAWGQSSPQPADAPPILEVSLGGGAAGGPVFPGAARYRTEPIFLGSLAYRGLAYLGAAGLGSSEIFSPGFHFGPVVDFSGGRNDTSDKHLRGLGNISPTVAVGVIGLWRLEGFELIGIVRQAVFHTNYGLVGRVQFDRRITLIPGRLTLLAGPEADFGNGRYERTWFGISQEQAADFRIAHLHTGWRRCGCRSASELRLSIFGAYSGADIRRVQMAVRLCGEEPARAEQHTGDIRRWNCVQLRSRRYRAAGAAGSPARLTKYRAGSLTAAEMRRPRARADRFRS